MSELLGVTLAVAGALAVAIQVLFVRIGTEKGRSNDALVVVLAVNVAVLVPLAIVTGYPSYELTLQSFVAFSSAGIVGTMLGRAFEYAGIQRIGASRSEPIKASQPLHAAVLAVVLLGETLTLVGSVGIVLIVAGIALLSWEGASTPDVNDENLQLRYFLYPIAAALFFGIEPIFAKFGFAEGTPAFVVALTLA